jgi:Fibronectin type III domain
MTLAPAAPQLALPADSATGLTRSPLLTWNISSGAVSYQLQVSTVSNFATTVMNQIGISTTSSTVTGLINNTQYYWRVSATNTVGTGPWSISRSFTTIRSTSVSPPVTASCKFELVNNYPNPFNPSTTISFSLPSRSFVSLKIFDVMGREVSTIVSEELPAGSNTRHWKACPAVSISIDCRRGRSLKRNV